MMRGGGGMGMGRPAWRRDESVLTQTLTPGIVKRVLKLALGYKRMLALFLFLVTVDAVLGTINPLILRDIINNGIGGHDSQLVIELALLAAGIATLDMLVTLVQRYVSARIGEVADLRPARRACSGTCSGCRSRSSPARRPARSSAGSTTTSSARSRRSRTRSARSSATSSPSPS